MKITYFNASWEAVITRFYIMMGVILIAGFTAQLWLCFLALPLFLSCMLGLRLEIPAMAEVRMSQLQRNKARRKTA